MSNLANAMLDNLTDAEIAAYSVSPENEGHIVIGSDRIVKVPNELKRIAVQYDHNIETVTFDCPRYWDGIDMSTMVVYINFECPDHTLGAYLAENVRVDEADESMMHFDWTIKNSITRAKGVIKFLVCIKNVDEAGLEVNHWNSELNSEMTISEGLECSEVVADQNSDVIAQLLLRMGKAEAAVDGGAGIMTIEQTTVSEAENGVNIITVTLTDGRQMIFSIRNGISPVRGTHYWTEEDKQEVINSVLRELPRAEDISV